MFGKQLSDSQVITKLQIALGIDTGIIYTLLWCLRDSERRRKDAIKSLEMAQKINMAFLETASDEVCAEVQRQIEFDQILYVNDLPLS